MEKRFGQKSIFTPLRETLEQTYTSSGNALKKFQILRGRRAEHQTVTEVEEAEEPGGAQDGD